MTFHRLYNLFSDDFVSIFWEIKGSLAPPSFSSSLSDILKYTKQKMRHVKPNKIIKDFVYLNGYLGLYIKPT